MSIFSSFDIHPQDIAHIAKRGIVFMAARMYGATNALFEKIVGIAPPGGAGIVFFPHDHGELGGIPIPRNNVFSYDFGFDSNGWVVTMATQDEWYRLDKTDASILVPTTSPPDAVGVPNIKAYASPGIDSDSTNVSGYDCAWEAKLLVKNATATALTARFYNRTTGTYSAAKATPATTSLTWLTFASTAGDEGIPCRGGKLNSLDLEMKTASVGLTSTRIVSLVISETRQSSQPQSTGTAYGSVVKP